MTDQCGGIAIPGMEWLDEAVKEMEERRAVAGEGGAEIECQVFSRIVGYIRPLGSWSEPKKREFADRKVYEVASGISHNRLNAYRDLLESRTSGEISLEAKPDTHIVPPVTPRHA